MIGGVVASAGGSRCRTSANSSPLYFQSTHPFHESTFRSALEAAEGESYAWPLSSIRPWTTRATCVTPLTVASIVAPSGSRPADTRSASVTRRRSASILVASGTNLTRGQQFTPILVASHRAGVKLFTLGHQASPQLETLAEEGDVRPMAALLQADPYEGGVFAAGC